MLYITQLARDLTDIYALSLGHCAPSGVMRIYQSKPLRLCYNILIYNDSIMFEYYHCVTEEGFDFDSGPYNVIFPPNAINASFNILITNDTLLELNETFTLNICPPDDFFVIDPDEAVVTIVDDDSKKISVTSSLCF